jgi:hypothetical protein
MNVFAKIFAQIFDSSIAADYVVRHIFMDMLVLADRDGVVDMTLDAISRRTNVPEELVAHAIAELMKDDRKSRSHEEDGRRLVAIDSHRDWGWQIVNYEHYRNIRDEEARRTYFRDKQREQRAKSTTKSSRQTLSNLVKDSPTKSKEVTQGEGEGEGDTETRRAKAPPPLDSGSELIAANWLLEELGVVADNGVRRVAADAIRLLAKEDGDVRTATEFIHMAGRNAVAAGEVINRFWFTDQKYRPAVPTKSRKAAARAAHNKAFLEASSDD